MKVGARPVANMTQTACRSQITAATEGGRGDGGRGEAGGGLRQAAGLQETEPLSVSLCLLFSCGQAGNKMDETGGLDSKVKLYAFSSQVLVTIQQYMLSKREQEG